MQKKVVTEYAENTMFIGDAENTRITEDTENTVVTEYANNINVDYKGKGDTERKKNSEILPSFESLFCFVVNEL